MDFLRDHLLTAVVFVPLLGALLLLAFPRHEASGARGFAMAVSLIDLALVGWAVARFANAGGIQLAEQVPWVPSFGISYALGVDGVALLLIGLTVFLAPIVILSTYSGVSEHVREYMVCLLFLQTGMLGAFVATDLFLFYVFWEVMLVPMYFLIGIWGGRRRIYAAVKFFLYTMAGSLLMLVAILYTVWSVRDQGGLTFAWTELSARLAHANLGSAETWLFLAFALAFAIKVPMFPFHTWLPDAHVEAPTGASVVLAGVLLKLGTFGFLRYALWLFPKAALEFLPAIGLLAVIGIIYGALVSTAQTDFKRLVAYSSVSHLGFVMLGLAAMTVTSVAGGVLQMVNHGISTGALFLLVGVIYERRHTRELEAFGGLAKVMPRYALIFVIMMLSSVGLPGLNGFVGEFLILVGSFRSVGVQVTTPTGELAWAGILAAEAVAVTSLLVLAGALWRSRTREQVGRATRISALGVVALIELVLVAPPLPFVGFGGGLLLRPLATARNSSQAFQELFAVLAVLAATGVIFAAVYLLMATQKVFFGPIKHAENAQLADLSTRESLLLAPLVVAAVVMGVYPQPFIDLVQPAVVQYTTAFRARAGLPAIAELAPPPLARDRSDPDASALPHLPGAELGPATLTPTPRPLFDRSRLLPAPRAAKPSPASPLVPALPVGGAP